MLFMAFNARFSDCMFPFYDNYRCNWDICNTFSWKSSAHVLRLRYIKTFLKNFNSDFCFRWTTRTKKEIKRRNISLKPRIINNTIISSVFFFVWAVGEKIDQRKMYVLKSFSLSSHFYSLRIELYAFLIYIQKESISN